MVITVEIQGPNGEWISLEPIQDFMPPASLSSDDPDGRHFYMFGFHRGHAGVWRCDASLGESIDFRVIDGRGELSKLSDLSEPYIIDVYRNGIGVIKTRLTHVTST